MNQFFLHFFSLGALLLTVSCTKADPEKKDPVEEKEAKTEPYKTEPVEVVLDENHAHYMGQIISSEQFQVPSEVNGVLIQRKMQAGETVKKGQSLGVIKPLSRGIGSKDYQILSPINGILGLWLVEEGTVVNSPNAVLTVYNPNRLKTVIHVTEEDRLKILNNKKSLELSAKLSISQQKLDAKFEVISVGSIIDSTTMTFPVELVIKHSNPRDLTPGSWMTINMDQKHPAKYMVSKNALKKIGEKDHLAVLDKNSKVNWIPVNVGEEKQGKVTILSGVNKDSIVVISNDKELEQGQSIEVKKG